MLLISFSSGGKNTSSVLGYSAHCNAISQACDTSDAEDEEDSTTISATSLFPYFVLIFTPISNRVQYLERVKSNHLPVDIPTVKGMWPYRYVSDLPLRVTSKQSKMDSLCNHISFIIGIKNQQQMTTTQAQDTQSFRISLLANLLV
ncbi:hypothetical protein T07_10394 [Trichinella nelsoni]|uniref:Uncharacterized protein n=1 Tax=Trichinella nelsoni TaxID=6336 RepID=A0A0V0RFK5_9BILA|nr:hypothetical protein T07_11443 [Trichinella nelsoni]KRX13032.1 hypothetical protein T07_10394 [Trichinella nelsoni]